MKKDLIPALVVAGGILVLAFMAKHGALQDYIDADTATRLTFAAIGLMIAWYGNRIPKKVVPSANARQAARVAGWAQVLSGLVYAGLWMLAPIPVAITGGSAAIVAGIAVTYGYCLHLRSGAKSI